jgi:acyl-CoA thioester hydrolase
MNTRPFKLEFEVRDYECDVQGIVNNAVYQNYLEHTRHVFLKQNGIDFIVLSKRGINLVVLRAELDYLYSLRFDDRFTVSAVMERFSRLRFGFQQTIQRLPDGKPVLQAKIIATALNEAGRPFLPKELEELIEKIIQA